MTDITPDRKEYVKDELAAYNQVAEVVDIGPGLTVVFKNDAKDIQAINSFTAEHGWYVAQIDTGHDNLVVQIMPITGVDDV